MKNICQNPIQMPIKMLIKWLCIGLTVIFFGRGFREICYNAFKEVIFYMCGRREKVFGNSYLFA